MKALLFHNPNAGSGRQNAGALIQILREAGFETTYCSTKGDDFPGLLRQGADLIVAAGGDGTVAKVLKGMTSRRIPVVIFPLGTANNMANSLAIRGIPADLDSALSSGTMRDFDIGSLRTPLKQMRFVEAVGIGALAKAMEHVDLVDGAGIDSAPGRGIARGRETLRRCLKIGAPEQVELVIDGRRFAHELLLLEITNIRFAGPALDLVPAAKPGSGLLHVVGLAQEQRTDFLAWLEGQNKAPFPFSFAQSGREIVVRWRGDSFHLDDIIQRPGANSLHLTLESERARILIPQRQV